MRLVQVQFAPWDKKYVFSADDFSLAAGDKVIVDTEFGMEIGDVLGSISEKEVSPEEREIKPVIRKANSEDLSRVASEKEREEALGYCRELISRYSLPMKLVDVRFALNRSRLTFAFVSDSRVDFRQLVKDLINHFNCSIRLTQIGSRDEARASGDCGHCGRGLCCRSFIKDFSSITSEMAEAQQVVHRGSDRLSGMCGRLLCCLAYEYDGYKELAKSLPVIGTKMTVEGKKGEVVGHHVLKQSVDVKFHGEKEGDYFVIEVELNKDKNKKK